MKQQQNSSAAWYADCELLAAELLKIPKAHWPRILRESAIFIADMESTRLAVRLVKTARPRR